MDTSSHKLIILPGTELFDACLASLPPPPDRNIVKNETSGEYNYIVRAGGSGLMECVHSLEAREYVFGGEYELRLSELPFLETYDYLCKSMILSK